MNVSDKLSRVRSKSSGLTCRSTVFEASLLLLVLRLHPQRSPKLASMICIQMCIAGLVQTHVGAGTGKLLRTPGMLRPLVTDQKCSRSRPKRSCTFCTTPACGPSAASSCASTACGTREAKGTIYAPAFETSRLKRWTQLLNYRNSTADE